MGWNDNGTSQVTVARALYGDADLNGMVNSADFSRVLANYGQSGKVWADGDFTYDGNVNSADMGTLLANYGQSLSALPVKALAIARMGAEPVIAPAARSSSWSLARMWRA